jgi:hypothetical protein
MAASNSEGVRLLYNFVLPAWAFDVVAYEAFIQPLKVTTPDASQTGIALGANFQVM